MQAATVGFRITDSHMFEFLEAQFFISTFDFCPNAFVCRKALSALVLFNYVT